MKEITLHSVVRLSHDLQEFGLRSGMSGAVICVFEHPEIAYEVEFVDRNGVTIAEVTLRPSDVTLVE